MADYNEWIPEQFGTKTESYGEGYSREVPGTTYYKDPTTGNYYDVPFGQRGYWAHPDEPLPLDFANAKLVASSEALNDPYIKSLGYQNDPAKAQALYQQKLSEPKAFYSEIGKALENDIFGNWSNSWEYEGLKDVKQQFNELKDVAPDVYYENLIADKAKQIGWSYGSGNPDYAKPNEEELKNQIPEAIKAGLSQQQINDIINKNVNESAQLQQTLAANAASGGNFWNQNLLGALKIGAFALGASGLDAALAGAASSGAGGVGAGSTGTGLTGGAGGSTGLLSGGTVGSITAPTSTGALGLFPSAESAIAAGAGSDLAAGASSFSPAGVGGLNAALPAAGSVGGAGSMSAALPAGTMIGDGTFGTILGASYSAAAPGQFATDIFGNAIPASSIGIGSTGAAGGYDLLSNLGNALKGAQLAKGLLGAGKNPAVSQPTGVPQVGQQQKQYAGVDYSPILNLLALKSPERSRNSLLG